MRLIDLYNLMAVISCPKCGQDPENMIIKDINEDNIICSCDNCHSKIQITYKIEVD